MRCSPATNASSIASSLAVAGFRTRRCVGDPVEEGVGVGLQPGDLIALGRLRRLERWSRLCRSSPGMGANRVKAAVRGNAVSHDRTSGTPLKPRKPAPRCQQESPGACPRRRSARPEHPVAVSQQLPAVRVGELAKCLLVAGASTLQHRLFERFSFGPCLLELCLLGSVCWSSVCSNAACSTLPASTFFSMPLWARQVHLCDAAAFRSRTVAVST